MLLIKKIIKENFSRKDLNKMLEIEKQYFLDYQGVIRKDEEDSGYVYDEQDIGEMFDDCEIVLGAYSNDELVGYVALSRGNYDVGEKPDYYIYNFMVDAKLRGQKLGTILLIRISEFLKEKDFDFVTLDVEADINTQKYYEKIGFKRFEPKNKKNEDEFAMIISKNEFLDWAEKSKKSLQMVDEKEQN